MNYNTKKINSRELSKEKIQTFIKEFLGSEQIKTTLDSFINEDSIEDFRKLLKKEFIIKNGKEQKYIFDLIIFLIVYEIASINEILKLSEEEDLETFKKILEEAVLFELGIYSSSKERAPIFLKMKENFLNKKILNIISGNSSILSYKDENNIKDEINRILDDSVKGTFENNEEMTKTKFVSYLNYFLDEEEDLFSEDNIHSLFVSINNKNPLAFQRIGMISFILNYNEKNILDRFNEILEKNEISASEFYYYKFINDTEKTFSNIPNHFFYKKFLGKNSLEEKEKCKALNSVFLKFLELLGRRTINYKD